MKPVVTFLAVVIFYASLACAQAQAAPAAQPSPGQAQAQPGTKQQPAAPKAPAPPAFPPELEKLAFLVGSWGTAEQHEGTPGMPAGASHGRAFFRAGPGSRSLIEQYFASGAGIGEFQGLGIISWDPKKQAYNAYWCDSMTPSGCQPMGTGKWLGKDLVFTGEAERGGKPVSAREVYTDITPNSFTFQMFMGENPKPTMTIKYTKANPLPRGPGRGPGLTLPTPQATPAPAPTPPSPPKQ